MAKSLLFNDTKFAKNRLIHLRRAYGARNAIKKNLNQLGVPFDVSENPSPVVKSGKFGTTQQQPFFYTNYIIYAAQRKLLTLDYTKDEIFEMSNEGVVSLAGYRFPKQSINNTVQNLGRDADINSICIVNDEGYLEERPSAEQKILHSEEVYVTGEDAAKWERVQAFARTFIDLQHRLAGYRTRPKFIGNIPLLPTLIQAPNDPSVLYMRKKEFDAVKDNF